MSTLLFFSPAGPSVTSSNGSAPRDKARGTQKEKQRERERGKNTESKRRTQLLDSWRERKRKKMRGWNRIKGPFARQGTLNARSSSSILNSGRTNKCSFASASLGPILSLLSLSLSLPLSVFSTPFSILSVYVLSFPVTHPASHSQKLTASESPKVERERDRRK